MWTGCLAVDRDYGPESQLVPGVEEVVSHGRVQDVRHVHALRDAVVDYRRR